MKNLFDQPSEAFPSSALNTVSDLVPIQPTINNSTAPSQSCPLSAASALGRPPFHSYTPSPLNSSSVYQTSTRKKCALFLNGVPPQLFSEEAIARHFWLGSRGITSVSLRGSSESRRTAIINFGSPEDAAQALGSCSQLHGRRLNLSFYMSYEERAAAFDAPVALSAAGPMSVSPNSLLLSDTNPPNNELVFSPVPRDLFSRGQIINLFNTLCPYKLENVTTRERQLPSGQVRRTAIITMADTESATTALQRLPHFQGERLQVYYRASRSYHSYSYSQQDPSPRHSENTRSSGPSEPFGDPRMECLEGEEDVDMAEAQSEQPFKERLLNVEEAESDGDISMSHTSDLGNAHPEGQREHNLLALSGFLEVAREEAQDFEFMEICTPNEHEDDVLRPSQLDASGNVSRLDGLERCALQSVPEMLGHSGRSLDAEAPSNQPPPQSVCMEICSAEVSMPSLRVAPIMEAETHEVTSSLCGRVSSTFRPFRSPVRANDSLSNAPAASPVPFASNPSSGHRKRPRDDTSLDCGNVRRKRARVGHCQIGNPGERAVKLPVGCSPMVGVITATAGACSQIYNAS